MDSENQQEILNECEIAWLAGIVEGEGSVALSFWNRNNSPKPKIGVQIKIYNTDGGIARKAVEILEKLGVGHYVQEREMKPIAMAGGKKYGGRDPMITITVSNLQQAYDLGLRLQPWMFGDKAARMDLVLKYLKRRIAKGLLRGRTIPLDNEDLALVGEFYDRFVTKPGNNGPQLKKFLNDYTHGTGSPVKIESELHGNV